MSFFTNSSLSALPELALVLGIMVIVHEFGHFAVAKLCGVRVETFAIGFGKRLFGVVHNGTDYCINLLPLGGYVKMAGEMGPTGEDSRATDDPAEYQNHPRWQRALITLAGPVANFILAFVLLAGLYATHNEVPAYVNSVPVADYISPSSPMGRTGIAPGDRIVAFDGHPDPSWSDLGLYALPDLNKNEPVTFLHDGHPVKATLFVESKGKPQDFDFSKLGIVPLQQEVPLQVASITSPDTPAARAGLQAKDRILSVDGHAFHSVNALAAYLHDQAGKPALLSVERTVNGQTQVIPTPVAPALMDTQEGKDWKLGFMNVKPPVKVERMPLGRAARQSVVDNLKDSLLVFEVLHRLFTRQVSVKSLSSPIGIGVQVHQAFQMEGWTPIVGTMAMISLQLGIFNLLPIPILDGGMMVFLFIETLLRRDINQQLKERVYQVAFVCLVLFAAVVIFNDITKFLPGHVKS